MLAGGRLRDLSAADPFVGAVSEALVLPDRHRGLQLVDQCVTRVEGLRSVRQETPTTTARSPTYKSPIRWAAATAIASGYLATMPSVTLRSSASADGRAEYDSAATSFSRRCPARCRRTAPCRPPPGRRSRCDLVNRKRGVPDGDQPDLTHLTKVPRAPTCSATARCDSPPNRQRQSNPSCDENAHLIPVVLYVSLRNQSKSLRRLGQTATLSAKLSAHEERGSFGDTEKPVDGDSRRTGQATASRENMYLRIMRIRSVLPDFDICCSYLMNQ